MSAQILGFCGSLRQGSYNRQLLTTACDIATQLEASIDIGEIRDFPLYDADLQEQGIPTAVTRVQEQMQRADAILFVSPEYNYSIPGALKNAIDWLSRLSPQPFAGKAVAIMGTSPGAIGTARMQYHLRQVMVFLDAHPLNKPEVMIGAYQDKYAGGRLVDAKGLEMVERQLSALIAWSRQLLAH